MEDVTALTRELVSIPSHEDETEAGDYLAEWLRSNTDATVTQDTVGNVFARRGSDGDALALIGHHDVVPPADPQVKDGSYVIDEREGRLYGRGTADMKGAVAAMACAFRDADPVTELVFGSFVGEETGGEGARAAIDNGFAPAYAVVGEGSTGYSATGVTDVAVTHRGRRGSTVTVSGTAAHASEPSAGDNAVYHACDVVDAIREVDPPAATVLGHDIKGSVVVTEIDGGSAWNIVPETCTLTVDERTVPDDRVDFDGLADHDRVEWTVDQDLPPMACDDPEFADAVLDAAANQQHESPAQVTKPHATDAGWLARAGTTCVVCGPAEPGEAHTQDESVSITVLDRCYQVYRDIASTWSG